MQTDQTKPGKKKVLQEIGSWALSIGVAIAIVFLLRTFVFTIINVEGKSMLETLHNGDRLYVSILSSKINGYERGDIVICYYPGQDHQCVKRVIGVPGDTVEIVEGVTHVNGEPIDEPYVVYPTTRSYAAYSLGDGEYFMMGDNRPISHDSRAPEVGAVSRIVGEVRFILWPFSRFGGVN